MASFFYNAGRIWYITPIFGHILYKIVHHISRIQVDQRQLICIWYKYGHPLYMILTWFNLNISSIIISYVLYISSKYHLEFSSLIYLQVSCFHIFGLLTSYFAFWEFQWTFRALERQFTIIPHNKQSCYNQYVISSCSIMLYESFRRKPGWRFTAGTKLKACESQK